MAKVKISEFNSNPALNTDIDSINIAEGCSPSGINDAIRELMAQLKDWQSGTSNDPYVVGSSGSLTLNQGTANTVPYLNGSKVVTSGTALQFDGRNIGVGTTPTQAFTNSRAIQLGSGGLIEARSNDSTTFSLASNAYLSSGGDWTYSSNNRASLFALTNGSYSFGIAPAGTGTITFTTAMTLDASSNLMVGGTSVLQSAKITAYGSVSAQNGGVDGTFANAFVGVYSGNSNEHNVIQTAVSSSGVGSGFRFKASNGGGSSSTTTALDVTRDRTVFYTNGTERARIDGGTLYVGTTSQLINETSLGVYSTGNTATIKTNSGPNNALLVWNSGTGGTLGLIKFFVGTSYTEVGSIASNGTSTQYNTSSDYRLKNTIAPMTGALAKVALLKPCTYKWNADGSDGQGFIAHELAEVCPDAVTGEKDAVDEQGNPKYQGIDVSFLVATLTAAIKEQQAIIESLTTRITALEGQ